MFACKLECLNIVRLIIDQDMFISLQVCNKVFREFEVPQNNKGKARSVLLIKGDQTEFAKQFIDIVE